MAVLLKVSSTGDGLAVVLTLLVNPSVGGVGVRRGTVTLPVQVLTLTGARRMGQGARASGRRGEVLSPRQSVAGEIIIPGECGLADVGTGAVLDLQCCLLVGGERGRAGRGSCGRGSRGS